MAKKGNDKAMNILRDVAHYLGYCLSNAVMILDIKTVILSSHFGDDGYLLAELVLKELEEQCFSGSSLSVEYCPFDSTGHTRGAALLVLNKSFTSVA
jgi:predicted NBD/HSP70 family sugar kinase